MRVDKKNLELAVKLKFCVAYRCNFQEPVKSDLFLLYQRPGNYYYWCNASTLEMSWSDINGFKTKEKAIEKAMKIGWDVYASDSVTDLGWVLVEVGP